MGRYILFILWICSVNCRADEKVSPDINGLYESSLIVTGMVEFSAEGWINFRIHTVLKNASTEVILPKQIIKFPGSRYGVLSTLNTDPVTEELIVYLSKREGNWYIYGGSQQVKKMQNGRIPFQVCQKNFSLTPAQYVRMKNQFLTTFRKVGDYAYAPYLSEGQFAKIAQTSAPVKCFFGCHQQNIHGSGLPEMEPPLPSPKGGEVDTTIYSFVEEGPHFPGGPEALMRFIQSHLPESLVPIESSIRGVVYCSFVVEKDGTLSQLIVLRGMESKVDAQVLHVFTQMPEWIPATQNGKKVRCRFIVPVKVE